MSSLYVFNPEHDWALSQNGVGGSAPQAAVALRKDLAFLPALMAADDDFVLVPNVAHAQHNLQQLGLPTQRVHFIPETNMLADLPLSCVLPWGWDSHICRELKRRGVSPALMPTVEQCDTIRHLSHRRHTRSLLQALHHTVDKEYIVGESTLLTSCEDVNQYVQIEKKAVLKAPWSSSGRGIMTVVDGHLTDMQWRRVQNVLQHQQGVMGEPWYDKVQDLAMEFYVDSNGIVDYLGLSLFTTTAAQYAGNLIADESYKRSYVNRFIPLHVFDDVCQSLCSLLQQWLNKNYQGLLGVDMMIVHADGTKKDTAPFVLHPCVEVNLRCTMGHVALALSKLMPASMTEMRIVHQHGFALQLSTPSAYVVKSCNGEEGSKKRR